MSLLTLQKQSRGSRRCCPELDRGRTTTQATSFEEDCGNQTALHHKTTRSGTNTCTTTPPTEPRTQELALWYLHHSAWVELSHGWVLVNSHNTPVLTSVMRQGVARYDREKTDDEPNSLLSAVHQPDGVRMSTFTQTDNHSWSCRTSILEGATFHKMNWCKFL